MQKLLRKILAVTSAIILAAFMMFSPVMSRGFFRPVIGSLGLSALPIRAEEQPVTDESKGIAALLTLLFANGIRFVGQWDDVSAGAQKMWNDFTTATGNTVTLAALGAGVAVAHGYMRTSAAVNNAVSAFQTWYQSAFNVPSSGNVNLPLIPGDMRYLLAAAGFQSGTASIYYAGGYDGNQENNDIRMVCLRLEDSTYYSIYFVSTSPFSVTLRAGSSSSEYVRAFNDDGGYYYNRLTYSNTGIRKQFYNGWAESYAIYTVTNNDYSTAIAYTFGAEAGLPDRSIEGQTYELKDGYNLNTDQSLLLDIANLSALVASIGLTLDSINDLVQDWPAIFDTPWADTDVPDITFPVPIEDTPDNTIPWVNVPDAVSPDPVPDYVPDNPATEGEYKVLGLENVFPFSIPFDLYYLVNVLVAEPETPSFTYALYDPTTSSLVSQEVNLHQFDTFAALLRKLETVLFIASLIFVTRGLIRS